MNKPIRVLQMIGGLNIGGSQSFIINLHENIDRSIIQFDYILDRPQNNFLVPVVEKIGAKVYYMPTFKGYNIFSVIIAWYRFFKAHPEYSIIHSHVRSYAVIYILMAKFFGFTTIIHSHSTSNGNGIGSIVKKVLQYPLRYVADYCFGCSKEAGLWLFGENVVNSDRYKMIPNAIDVDAYRVDQNIREYYRNNLDVNDKLVFIHVGRLHPAKNHSFLLDVFADLKNNVKNAKLFIVGDGELRKDIEIKIKSLGLDKDVIMLGNRSDVSKLLMAADCFLFPSNWEGLPVTVVEAQASGLPCFISENVTDDVIITDLAHKLPINEGVGVWTKSITKSRLERKEVSDDIKKAGFDVKTTVKWMQNFYEGLAK